MIVIVYHYRWSCANHRRVVSQTGAVSMIVLAGTGIADGMVNGATGRLVDYHDGTNDHRSLMITFQVIDDYLPGMRCWLILAVTMVEGVPVKSNYLQHAWYMTRDGGIF